MSAPEAPAYANDSVKWILADYIDNTADLWIHECNKALEEYNKTLPKDKQLKTNECVQLMLDGLYLKHVWRVIGGDPYFANWAAQTYSEYVIGYLNNKEFSNKCHNYGLSALEGLSNGVTVSKENLKAIPEKAQRLRTQWLKNTVLKIPDSNEELNKKKVKILLSLNSCLRNIFEIMTKKGKKSDEQKQRLQKALLPHGLIFNIRANNRLFEKKE